MSKLSKGVFLAMAITAVASVPAVYGQDGGVPEGSANSGVNIVITNCNATRHDFISNDVTGLTTDDAAYVAVPGMSKTINQAVTGCVIVVVSSYAFAADSGGANQLQFVRVVLDPAGNLRTCSPIEWQWDGDDDVDGDSSWARTHGAVCAFANVPAGAHVVQMQHRSAFGGDVFLHRPSMDIEHR